MQVRLYKTRRSGTEVREECQAIAIEISWLKERFVPEVLKPQRYMLTIQRGSIFITSGPGIIEGTKWNPRGSLMPEVQPWAMSGVREKRKLAPRGTERFILDPL